MPREFARSERVAQMVIRQLAIILRTEVKDPRVSDLTITDVEVTKDLRQAKVFVTSMDSALDSAADVASTDRVNDIMAAVERASGFLRRALAREIDLRHCPNLIFVYDDSIAHGAKMSALIDKALESGTD